MPEWRHRLLILIKTTDICCCDVFDEEVETKELCAALPCTTARSAIARPSRAQPCPSGTDEVGYGCEASMLTRLRLPSTPTTITHVTYLTSCCSIQ
ncbi:hypothetical protein C8Q80DRAFT_407606 [Daedaleopsis nitida]|nr:hypothetical protein C8Q80DRAFT_407606 [Daedaleopsis nitida]